MTARNAREEEPRTAGKLQTDAHPIDVDALRLFSSHGVGLLGPINRKQLDGHEHGVGELAAEHHPDGALRLVRGVVGRVGLDCLYIVSILSIPPKEIYRCHDGEDPLRQEGLRR